MTTPPPGTRYFFNVNRQVRVRSAPGLRGSHIKWVYPGEQIAVDASSRREVDGYVWWRHTAGWTAEKHITNDETYLTGIITTPTTAEPPPETEIPAVNPDSTPRMKTFRVTVDRVRTRSIPSLNGSHVRWLFSGEQLSVDPTSRREADGYVWWRHVAGWSAERNLNGTEVFMTTIADAPKTKENVPVFEPAEPEPATTEDKSFRVGRFQVRVRSGPSLSAAHQGWLPPGQTITVVADSRTEADGYIWWQHSGGWSAERNSTGSTVFLLDPDSFTERPDLETTSSASGLPTEDTLPYRNTLFQQLPIPLGKIQWWQYFGNNVFAYNLWQDGARWYKYAQGLHGGLDFGNSQEALPVTAGINGQFIKRDELYNKPYGMWVRVGDYTVIYGHLNQPADISPGATITPTTVLGQLDLDGQKHLHLEIRYKGKWIINPLLLMSATMRNSLIAKFPPDDTYFYHDTTWTQWQSPLDQPIIELAGDLIGPHTR